MLERLFDKCTVGSCFRTYYQAVTYVLQSAVRPRLNAPNFNEHERRELTATAETYEAALEYLRDQVPEGWVLLGIDRYVEQPAD
jgi:uncharacterized membrane-anchored protein